MVILSVDYGDVRTGIAVCDKNELLASPIGTINQPDVEKLCDEIIKICNEYKAEMICLGLPKNMDGSEGFRAEHVKEFAEILREKSGLPLEFVDERLTTVAAHRALNETNTRGKKRKNIVDTVSAVMILENFLTIRKNQK
ncbi:MAG TPA: Holliday junction resolvase RuvX [Clostridiales bacterium]|nr:Holliday junction resolvase RuvX [Clostridiales bacterium]